MLKKSILPFFKFTIREAPAILLLFVILVLIIKGYPLPHRDDLLFIGSPINYVQTGHFDNPFCIGFTAQFHTIKFVYMPLQAFILGGWLKVFGVSTASLLSFQWFFYFVGMVSLYFLGVQKFLLKRNVGLLVCTAYLIITIQMGLRPDACGFGFVLAGLCWIDAKKTWGKFFGFSLCGLAFISSPLTFGLFLPIAFFLYIQDKSSPFYIYLFTTLGSAIASVLILGIIINFDYKDFFLVFIKHVNSLGNDRSSFMFLVQLLTDKYQMVLKLPLYICTVILSGFVIYTNQGLGRKNMIVLTACLLFSLILYTEKTTYFSGLIICWIIIAIGFNGLSKGLEQHVYTIACLLLFVLNQSAFLIPLVFQETSINMSKSEIEMKTKKYKKIAADTEAARYIYDYKLPTNFFSLNFYDKGFYPKSFAECKKEEIWLYSPGFSYYFEEKLSRNNIEFVSILGKELKSVPVYPHKILMYHR